ncbi:MAG: zf-HC2 domain-containing protein [Planctomycetes bacterium]|nr:zf-HC2 domain-containing protein [Planctomycetota bacterium]
MNCTQCRSLISEFLEESLPPEAHREVSQHLSRCAACEKERRDLQKTLVALRALDREKPPAGLYESTLARLEAAQAAPPRAAAWESGHKWLLALAAALLIAIQAVLAGFFLSRERHWKDQAAGLQENLGQAALESRRLSGELERLESQARSQEKLIADLKIEIQSARSESRRLEGEVARLEKAQEERAAPALPRPLENRIYEEDRGVGQQATVLSNVFFRRRGDSLELKIRGPKEKVIPELIAIASDESEPKMASLALSALENLSDSTYEARPKPERDAGAEEPPGWLRWWSRRTEGLACAFGMGENEPGESEEDNRRSRLKSIEESRRGK